MSGQVEESEPTPHMQSEIHALPNGVTSDDQLPQTPQVLSIEEQSQVGPSDLQSQHQEGDRTFEWVNGSFDASASHFHDPHLDSFLNAVGFGPIDAVSTPLLHTMDKISTQQQPLAGDPAKGSTSQQWTAGGNSHDIDTMETCDEDAEGEDEDAEGEEDLSIMA